MGLVAIIISFLALLASIVGKPWNDKKKGIGKLTGPGWVIVIIGLISTILSVINHLQDQRKISIEQQNTATFRKLANHEIKLSTESTLRLWKILYIDICQKFYSKCELKDYRDVDKVTAKDLQSEKYISLIDSIDFLTKSPSKMLSKTPWYIVMGETASLDRQRLNEIWIKYAPYLNTETILELQQVISHPFFYSMTSLDELTSEREDDYNRAFLNAYLYSKEAKKGFVSFIEEVEKLKSRVNKLD